MQNFQILIVSAVNICKQCLQTASASGDFVVPRPLPLLRPWTTDSMGYSPQMKIFGGAPGAYCDRV